MKRREKDWCNLCKITETHGDFRKCGHEARKTPPAGRRRGSTLNVSNGQAAEACVGGNMDGASGILCGFTLNFQITEGTVVCTHYPVMGGNQQCDIAKAAIYCQCAVFRYFFYLGQIQRVITETCADAAGT